MLPPPGFPILLVLRPAVIVRAFLRTNAHFTVPLETHAFALESRFAVDPEKVFSVEEQIRLWLREGRY